MKVDPDKIDKMLRLANAPVDEELLRRYFDLCLGKEIESRLKDAERRWITVNLRSNPSWREKWKALEDQLGKSVDWQHLAFYHRNLTKPKAETDDAVTWLATLQSRWAFGLAAVAVVLVVLYGSLWLVGRWRLPETYKWASVEEFRDLLQVRVRGESAEAVFSAGVESMLAAKQDWFGLFPHYDRERVESAVADFGRAFEDTSDPFQRAEIAFFLAKAYLMKEDETNARRWLNITLAQNVADYRQETIALLAKLDAN